MKLTLEELKGLNIKVYIDWLTSEMQKIHYASREIPRLQKRLARIIMNSFRWYMYFNILKPQNMNVARYEKYQQLFKEEMNSIEKEIDELNDDLEQVTVLASAEDNVKTIEEYRKKEASSSKNPNEEVIDINRPSKPFTREDFDTFEDYTNKFLDSGYLPKESLNLMIAKTINFYEIEGFAHWNNVIFNSHLEYDLSKFKRMQQVNGNAIQTVLKEALETDFKYVDFILNAIFCREFFYNTDILDEFAKIAYYSHVANEDIEPLPYIINEKQLTHPQKIILLDKIGFFDLEIFNNLTNRQKDNIISLLINEDETNTRKYINGLTTKDRAGNYNPYKNKNNEIIVDKLLN